MRWHRLCVVLLGVVLLLAAACGGETPPQAADVTAGAQESVVPEPEASSPAPWSAAELESASLTREFSNPSGYTCTIELTVWRPVPKRISSPVAHPQSDEAVITPDVDYDPTMDTVIPFTLTLTNTTKGFDLEEVGLRYRLTSQESEWDTETEARTLEAWAWYSDGLDVTTWDLRGSKVSQENGNDDTWPSVEWDEPLAPGDSVTQCGYFVYRDHPTPNEPQGNKGILDDVIVMPSYSGGTATGANDTTGLTLTGKVVDTGMAW